MMESTPRNRTTRFRRAPTPKLSERKKKLFNDETDDTSSSKSASKQLNKILTEEDEDSDLGPMSPLQFSSSPSIFTDKFHETNKKSNENLKSHRIDFSNILSDKLERINSRYMDFAGDQRKDLDRNNDEDDVVEPLCSSMEKMTGVTETSSNSLDCDPICQTENYAQQMKTPNELSILTGNGTDQGVRGVSFRKSLIFDTGLTPHDDEPTPNGNTTDAVATTNERPKAKTSLSFSEPTISTKSFYGKTVERPIFKQSECTDVVSHHISTIKAQKKSKPKSMLKKRAAQHSKGPSLWRYSGVLKPSRFKHRHTKKQLKVTKKLTPAHRLVETEANKGEFNKVLKGQSNSTIEQNLRLQKILQEQTNAFSASREINWNVSGAISEHVNTNTRPFGGISDDDENDDPSSVENTAAEDPAEAKTIDAELSNRKFFKSKSSNTAKKYRIMSGISATLKRGGDLKLEPPRKRTKRYRAKREDTVVLQNEITSIIDRLSSPSKSEAVEISQPTSEAAEPSGKCTETGAIVQPPSISEFETLTNEYSCMNVDKYRQLIPYNTCDPQKINQQESILELLISNDICTDETFKIFIAEPDLHKDEASRILDNLYCVNTVLTENYEEVGNMATEWVKSEVNVALESTALTAPTNDVNSSSLFANIEVSANQNINKTIDVPMSPASQISTMTSSLVLDCSEETESKLTAFFPIFNKNFIEPKANSNLFIPLNSTAREWKPIGNQQYQLDAGQKAFGMKQCPQCEMTYSVHEPEDELLHLKYHNSVQILTFKGWIHERTVTEIPDWGINGRIIFVCERDSKVKKERVKEVLSVVDRDLGFTARSELAPKTLVYFAIAKQQIIGVCVAQPLTWARRLATENGVECCTMAKFPARCGISRIWVAPSYRRNGIASKIITAVRGHFVFGCFLSFDEIAFSSPTEAGKRLAANLSERQDFLVYDEL